MPKLLNMIYHTHIKRIIISLMFSLFSLQAYSLEYTLACGSLQETGVSVKPALLLSGGADTKSPDEKAATQWLLKQADKGDYLVIRAGGLGKQAKWICNNFSPLISSASEVSIDSQADANHPAIVRLIESAEVIWIAGGDQTLYSNYWKGTALAKALNKHLVKKAVGGTSAGMAILGDYYYAPRNKAVVGSELLNNPYHVKSQDLFHGDLLKHPFLSNVINETHVDRKIKGETRHSRAFGLLARISASGAANKAIALYEGSFLAVDELGRGKVFGHRALFLRALSVPENMQEKDSLKWNNQGEAVQVFNIAGSSQGNGDIDLINWTFNSTQPTHWFTNDGYTGLKTPL